MKAIVAVGGDAVAEDTAHLGGADRLIAADAGAAWLDQHGARPDLIVGDMDSIDPLLLARLAGEGVVIERHPVDKDASDAELAVRSAAMGGATEIVLLGALGGSRPDHELTNVLLLAGPWAPVRVRLVRGATSIEAVRGGQQLTIDGGRGDLVTLMAVGGDATEVHTAGLRFPLDGETLGLGSSRGLSNRIARAPATVSVGGGVLLVIRIGKEQDR